MFMPVWENSGSTRTKRLFMDSSWRSFSPDMPDDFDFPSWTTALPQPIMLGPKATTWGGECTIPINILLAANKGECKIYLWGALNTMMFLRERQGIELNIVSKFVSPGIPTFIKTVANHLSPSSIAVILDITVPRTNAFIS